MKKHALITGLIILAAIVLTACGQQPASPPALAPNTATATLPPTATATSTPTVTQSPTNTATPSPTPVYGGYSFDPHIVKRITKGREFGIAAQRDVLAVLTHFGVYVYDVKEKKEINFLPVSYNVSGIDLFFDQGNYYVLIGFYTTHKTEDGQERIQKQGLLLWNAITGKQVWEFEAPGKIINWTISPDKKTLAISCLNYDYVRRLHFINISTGIEQKNKRMEVPQNGYITYTPDGGHLIFFSDEIITFEANTREIVAKSPSGQKDIGKTFLSPDGGYLLLSLSETTKVYRKNQDGNFVFRFSLPGGRQIGFLSDANQIAVVRGSTTIPIYDLDLNGQKIGELETSCEYRETFFQLSDGAIGLACTEKDEIIVQTLGQGEKSVIAKGFVIFQHAAVLSNDGTVLATRGLSGNESVYLWDITSGDLIRRIDAPYPAYEVFSFSISPSNKTLATYAYNGASLSFWDISSGEIIATSPIRPEANSLFFSSTDDNIFFVTENNELVAGNILTNETRTIYKNGRFTIPDDEQDLFRLDERKFIFSERVSSDGKSVVLSILSIAENGVSEITIPAKNVNYRAVSVSKDNRILAVSYFTGEKYRFGLIVFDLDNLTEICHIELKSQAQSVSIDPNNKWVAVGFHYSDISRADRRSDPKTTSIFDIRTGQELVSFGLENNRFPAYEVLFTADGQNLIVSSLTIDIWDIDSLMK